MYEAGDPALVWDLGFGNNDWWSGRVSLKK